MHSDCGWKAGLSLWSLTHYLQHIIKAKVKGRGVVESEDLTQKEEGRGRMEVVELQTGGGRREGMFLK